jgi:hypothetical protein
VKTALTEELGFSGPLTHASVVRDVTDFPVTVPVIVVNLDSADAYVGNGRFSALPSFSSTILHSGTVTGGFLALLTLESVTNGEAAAREAGWTDFYGSRPGTPVLLRSPQTDLGVTEFDPSTVLRQGLPADKRKYSVKANLWFSPAGTDCGIHNQHDFIEIHTQISGLGRMQKFTAKDHGSLYEDQLLSPGVTNSVPFCLQQEDTFVYPWHQYRADTDCVWLAIEYHLI